MGESIRQAYGRTLAELGRENQDIVVLDADLAKSTMTSLFAKEHPERFFDCGIAEQNMIGIAAGLAASGKTVFASTFAVFAPGRCFDQIRMCVAQTGLDVKIVTTHGGVTVGEDGTSHQAIEDLALACSFPGFRVIVPADAVEAAQAVRTAANSYPGFRVIVPADAVEAAQAVRTAANSYGPFHIRLCRPSTPLVYDDGYAFTLGKAATLREGKDVTIIATGIMVATALQAARSWQPLSRRREAWGRMASTAG